MIEPRSALRILVVEDEEMVAELIAEALTDAAYGVVGPFGRFSEALEAARTESFDVALLDINLAGRPIHPIAEALVRRNIPFVFLTGYGRGGRPPEFSKAPVVGKPFQSEDLLDALQQALTASAVE